MTDFAHDSTFSASSERSTPRFRGPTLPKLHFPSAFHPYHPHPYEHPHHPLSNTQSDHPKDHLKDQFKDHPTVDPIPIVPQPFVSAHPSPEVSDDSDCERELVAMEHVHVPLESTAVVPLGPLEMTLADQERRRLDQHREDLARHELSISHHLLLASLPLPPSTTPPHSPLSGGKRPSLSVQNKAPLSDPSLTDALIRQKVNPKLTSSLETDNAFFWPVGKLSEFSFSDRFVRSRVFAVQDNLKDKPDASLLDADKDCHMVDSLSVAGANTPDQSTPLCPQTSWRLRLYPHGRGDRHRDSEYIGLYLQQEIINNASAGAINARRNTSAEISLPTPANSRNSVSSASRRSVSGASLAPVRRHVTLFIATERGDCLVKQDLVEWFSGNEGGLGFSRMVSRKAVQDAVRTWADEEGEIESELEIVAGVVFHQ